MLSERESLLKISLKIFDGVSIKNVVKISIGKAVKNSIG